MLQTGDQTSYTTLTTRHQGQTYNFNNV